MLGKNRRKTCPSCPVVAFDNNSQTLARSLQQSLTSIVGADSCSNLSPSRVICMTLFHTCPLWGGAGKLPQREATARSAAQQGSTRDPATYPRESREMTRTWCCAAHISKIRWGHKIKNRCITSRFRLIFHFKPHFYGHGYAHLESFPPSPTRWDLYSHHWNAAADFPWMTVLEYYKENNSFKHPFSKEFKKKNPNL